MGTTYRNKGNSEKDLLDSYIEEKIESADDGPEDQKNNRGGWGTLLVVVIIAYLVFGGFNTVKNAITIPGSQIFASSMSALNEPSEDLLNRMNSSMVEMGYTGLNHDDLRELRSEGVSATYISNVRGLGFTDLTLEEAVRLANADASSAFMAMMIELGYDLSIDDFVRLRNAGVTAYYTSNVHDLGYRDVTVDQLVRMQRIGLSTSLIERLQEERGEDVPLEDIIRYRISNQ
ncbi:MAG: hypothetical protein WEA58_10630 [Balneolaceae bacterium]